MVFYNPKTWKWAPWNKSEEPSVSSLTEEVEPSLNSTNLTVGSVDHELSDEAIHMINEASAMIAEDLNNEKWRKEEKGLFQVIEDLKIRLPRLHQLSQDIERLHKNIIDFQAEASKLNTNLKDIGENSQKLSSMNFERTTQTLLREIEEYRKVEAIIKKDLEFVGKVIEEYQKRARTKITSLNNIKKWAENSRKALTALDNLIEKSIN